LPSLRSIRETVTVPCLIDVAKRRISSQWARMALMFNRSLLINGLVHHKRHRPSGCRAWYRPGRGCAAKGGAQQVHQREDVISEACRVGVVLFDTQVGFVV